VAEEPSILRPPLSTGTNGVVGWCGAQPGFSSSSCAVGRRVAHGRREVGGGAAGAGSGAGRGGAGGPGRGGQLRPGQALAEAVRLVIPTR
jgi:hypothetical protein